jgi:hypothetical protein
MNPTSQQGIEEIDDKKKFGDYVIIVINQFPINH